MSLLDIILVKRIFKGDQVQQRDTDKLLIDLEEEKDWKTKIFEGLETAIKRHNNEKMSSRSLC